MNSGPRKEKALEPPPDGDSPGLTHQVNFPSMFGDPFRLVKERHPAGPDGGAHLELRYLPPGARIGPS